MWCWIVEKSKAIRVVILILGLIGGGIGLYLARSLCLTADQNLLCNRFQMGMELLSLNPERYTARVAGASMLSDILNGSSMSMMKKFCERLKPICFRQLYLAEILEDIRRVKLTTKVGRLS